VGAVRERQRKRPCAVGERVMVSAVTIVVILIAMAGLTAIELSMFWALGERDDRRRR
jgi:hypothetical protein